MNKSIKYILLTLFLSFFQNTFAVAGVAKDYKEQTTTESGFSKFVKSYILPVKSPVFGEKRNAIYLFGGYAGAKRYTNSRYFNIRYYGDFTLYNHATVAWRDVGQVAFTYSVRNKIGPLNARLSFGLFAFLITQNIDYIMNNEDRAEGKTNSYSWGFEIIEEFIFGHPNLYLTLGAGISSQQVFKSNANTNNNEYNSWWNDIKPNGLLWNNSNANFVVKAAIGHRFDCGLFVEATYKHYSNGMLSELNWGFDFIGATIGWTF